MRIVHKLSISLPIRGIQRPVLHQEVDQTGGWRTQQITAEMFLSYGLQTTDRQNDRQRTSRSREGQTNNVQIPAELMDPVQRLAQEAGGEGEDEPHVSRVVEAFPRHAVDALLADQLLNEVQVCLELGEPFHVHLDHHVHGASRHDGDQSRGVPQLPEGEVSVILDCVDGVVIERLRCVLQDGGQGSLDESVGADDPLTHAHQTLPDLVIKHLVPVVDNDPADPPAGHQEPLCEAAAGQDGHGGGEGGDGDVRLTWEHKVLVDLVRDDWDFIFLRNGENVLQVLHTEH